MKPKKSNKAARQGAFPLSSKNRTSARPDFKDLLNRPAVSSPLPKDFDTKREAAHLDNLWINSPELQEYKFHSFVHAGGSGMVFKVTSPMTSHALALKIAREKLVSATIVQEKAIESLSPVDERELRGLARISHPNVVRLYNTISNDRGVFAIATSYVEDPQPLDQYLKQVFAQAPKRTLHFSPARLDAACVFVIDRLREISSAVAYMHKLSMFHCDIKPANILVDAKKHAMLTDLGTCVHPEDLTSKGKLRIHFTWMYAHPELTSMSSQPAGISGGGLKASAEVSPQEGIGRFDLYALGRTIQEALGVIESEFGERCYASYGFRFLHLIACLLLDGKNTPLSKKVRVEDSRRFVSDIALDYPVAFFGTNAIRTADELVGRLSRFSKSYSLNADMPELDTWHPETLNTGCGAPIPLTDRIKSVFNHPCLRRLKTELQLGWLREVYPGATHSRWSHSLGVLGAALDYYNALLSDPEVPTARILLSPDDIKHGILAAALHDIGQTAFAHDIEAACPNFLKHEEMVARLLDEKLWGDETLRKTIEREWKEVDIKRVIGILGSSASGDAEAFTLNPIDGIASDIINGPIDADKLDYLTRDAVSCGVPYGKGIDRSRFLRALTVDVKEVAKRPKIAIAYRAKGAPAIESLLLARYQMYGAVYWHHTFRCIQAMFAHAAAATLGNDRGDQFRLRGAFVDVILVRDLFYHYVVLGLPWHQCLGAVKKGVSWERFSGETPSELAGERALEFFWRLADDGNRKLIGMIGKRVLFKRVFEMKTADLGESFYYKLAQNLEPVKRISIAEKLQRQLLNSIQRRMSERSGSESTSEPLAKAQYDGIAAAGYSQIVIDYPIRGVPEEKNFPREIGDPERKYIAGKPDGKGRPKSVFEEVRIMQMRLATVRIFASPALHMLVTRYLDPGDVFDCVGDALPVLKTD